MGLSIPGGLEQDQRQQHDERAEPEPARVHLRHDRRPEDHARQQPDDDRQHASPDSRQCIAIDPQDVGVEDDLDRDECRIEDAIGEEQQRDRNGDRREAVSERTVDDRGAERDEDECELCRVHRLVEPSRILSVFDRDCVNALHRVDVERVIRARPRRVSCRNRAPVDPQLPHARAQRMRVDLEQARRPVRALDSAMVASSADSMC